MLKRLLKGQDFILMTFEDSFDQLSQETNFGGLPVYNRGDSFIWPSCKSCKGNMQYLGKINDGNSIHLIFMCQNNPGCCDEWCSDSGGNTVVKFNPNNLHAIEAPEGGETVRKIQYTSKSVAFKDLTYNDARVNWSKKNNTSLRHVLGLFGGNAEWLQSDETPMCPNCNKNMRFIAQLETGPDHKTEMNFGGGGCAYLFSCSSCDGQAKFLWQC